MSDNQTPDTAQPVVVRRPAWLLPVALVCMAAILGAAGTVLMTGIGSEAAGGDQRFERNQIRAQTDLIAPSAFNPHTPNGQKLAKVAFRFQYSTVNRYRDQMRERIRRRDSVIRSDSLMLLMSCTPQELTSRDGLAALERDLIDRLNQTVFPDGLGEIDKILWEQIVVR